MRKLLSLSVLLSVVFIFNCQAQIDTADYFNFNLVNNPGFEDLRRDIPIDDIDGSKAFRNSIAKWASPTQSTPDLHYDESFGGSDDGARTGYGVIGILTHNPSSKRSQTYREYIQTKLDKTLVKGQEYYIELWVKRSINSALASNNIGVILRPDPIIRKDWYPLLHKRPIINSRAVINKDYPEWTKISGTYIASGSERFMIIGNFYNNILTKFEKATDVSKTAYEQAYYLIDDVGLYMSRTPPPPEPEPEPEPETLANMDVEVGQVIKLDRIYFETAKWTLLPASYEELDQLVALMNLHEGMKIAIHGHTDSRGKDPYNQNLSENRAKAVYQYLLDNQIDLARIEYVGFGESNPVADNDTAEGRQINRRVEFVVLEISPAVEVENVAGDGY